MGAEFCRLSISRKVNLGCLGRLDMLSVHAPNSAKIMGARNFNSFLFRSRRFLSHSGAALTKRSFLRAFAPP